MKARSAELPAPTARLSFREFEAGDLDDLMRLDRDPRVMRYVANGKPLPRSEIEAALGRFQRYPALYPGLGLWHTSRRDNGEFIGWFALKYAGRSCDVEIGYRLLPRAWGQGYATEGASALLHYALDRVGLDRVIGVTHPQNVASQRVLVKAGLRSEGYGFYYNKRLRLFAYERPAP